jgi:hypothetical protein
MVGLSGEPPAIQAVMQDPLPLSHEQNLSGAAIGYGTEQHGIFLALLLFEYITGSIYTHMFGNLLSNKHSWSNGRIIAFQAIGPGSTPGGCTHPSHQLH